MKLFRKKTKELRFLKKNLHNFEKEMFNRLNELEGNLENLRGEDGEKYDHLISNESKQVKSVENLTKEILHSVESLEKNQKVLSEEIERLKGKIKS